MTQTDSQTVKSTRWGFTAYEQQWHLFEKIPPGIAEWGWQTEICPDTKTPHYQGYIRTSQQQRRSWLSRILPGVHLNVCGYKTPNKDPKECWLALIQYCKKKDTSVAGTQVHEVNKSFTKYSYNEHLFKRIADVYSTTGFPAWRDTPTEKDVALRQIKDFARLDIRNGHREVSWILADQGWISQARECWRDLLISHGAKPMVD